MEVKKALKKITRETVKTVSGVGASAVVHSVCKPFMPETGIAGRVLFEVGTFGISCVVVSKVDAYYDELFDEIEKIIEEVKKSNELNKKEKEAIEKELNRIKKEAKKKTKKSTKKTKDEAIEASYELVEE